MDVIILHSAMVEASRALIASLGVTVPEGDDVTVQVGDDAVRIISKHALAIAAVPAFQAYPAVEAAAGLRVKCGFSDWTAARAWAVEAQAEEPEVEEKIQFTPKEFRLQKLTQAERIAIEEMIDPASTDPNRFAVRDIEKTWGVVDYVDLLDPDTVTAVNALEAVGVLAAGRAAEILTP